jgi:hypothetical protein
MACGLGISVALSGLLAVYEHQQLKTVEGQARKVAALVKEAATATDKAVEAAAPRKPNAELELTVRELEAQLKARQDIVDALRRGLVGTTGGFSEYMRVFARQTVQGVWLTGFDITAGGDELTIAGRTLNADLVPAYLERLNREAAVQGRSFGSMVINQAPEGPKFEQQPSDPKQPGTRAASGNPVLEFTLASSDPGHGGTRPGGTAPRPGASAALLQNRTNEAPRSMESTR